jgi:hypothetical protein
MKSKSRADQRQAVIKAIVATYGGIDKLDTACLAVRFKCSPQVIIEDYRCVDEALKADRQAQQRAAALEKERAAELVLAQQILKGGGSVMRDPLRKERTRG